MTNTYFEMTGAGGGFPEHRIRRPMSELEAVTRDLDEIEARAQSPDLDFKEVWRNYNQNRGTPTNASMKPAQSITEAEVRKRLGK